MRRRQREVVGGDEKEAEGSGRWRMSQGDPHPRLPAMRRRTEEEEAEGGGRLK